MEDRCRLYAASSGHGLSSEWTPIESADFPIAKMQCCHELASQNDPRTLVSDARSLRYRSQVLNAISVLETACEQAKWVNCDDCLLTALAEMVICFHQLQQPTRIHQLSQQFHSTYFLRDRSGSPSSAFLLVLALESWWRGDRESAIAQCISVTGHPPARGYFVTAQLLLAEMEWATNRRSVAQLRLWNGLKSLQKAGNYCGALATAEKYTHLALMDHQWEQALISLSVMTDVFEILQLREQRERTLRWRMRLENALCLSEQDVRRN